MKIALVIAIFTLLTTTQGPAPSQATHGHRHAAAPAPAVDCSSLILNMADCLSFVSNGRSTTKPEQSCCSGLKSVLSTDAECLCEAFKSSAQLGVDLNVTKALTLPAACKLSSPSVPTCALSESPAAAPGPAVSPAPAGGSSAIGGNEQAPNTSPGNSAPVGGTLSLGYLVSALALGLFLTLKNM